MVDKEYRFEFSFNARAMNAVLSGLSELEFVKVTHYKTTKEMCDKLKNKYEGDGKVKVAKLKAYK